MFNTLIQHITTRIDLSDYGWLVLLITLSLIALWDTYHAPEMNDDLD